MCFIHLESSTFLCYNTSEVMAVPMRYDKLFCLMHEKGLTTYKIRKERIVTETTLQKLREGKNVTTDSLGALCAALHCQPGDLMEYVGDE